MKAISHQLSHFIARFSLPAFLFLTFGLPFLTESLLLFLQKQFSNETYHPLYAILFLALLFLYGCCFSQIQIKEKEPHGFSLKAALISTFFWLLLSPLVFFRFYQLFLAWRPLSTQLLTFLLHYRWQLLPAILAFYVVLLYLLFRFLLTPKLLNQQNSLKESLQLSWQLSNKPFLQQFWHFFIVPVVFLIVAIFLKALCLQATQWLDHEQSALLLLLFYRISRNSLFALFFLYLASDGQKINQKGTVSTVWLVLPIMAAIGLYTLDYQQLLQTPKSQDQISISHRGVSNRNGVQNSLSALKKTNKQFQPDLVEIDVQESADHQLVVVHDEDLKALANRNLRIDSTSWRELSAITLKEHGYTSKLSLLSDYLESARQVHQKLLIELKVTKKTKTTIVDKLLSLKGQLADHQFQSMDLETVQQVKNLLPNQQVGYILPFDSLGAPRTSVDFVNIEAITATSELIHALQQRKQTVYVWSVNSPRQKQVFQFLPVQGLLTDDLRVLTTDTDSLKAKTASIIQFN